MSLEKETRTSQFVRFGVYLPAYHLPTAVPPTARFLASYAEQAEAVGFDSLWTIDHLFVSPPSYRVAFLDPMSVLAVAAAVTERATLGTGILVLPLRDPVLTAKALATIDVMSGGRLIFGAGVGWGQEEFKACQIQRSTRGPRMDEMLEVIRGLWTEDSYSYSGTYFQLQDGGWLRVRCRIRARRFGLPPARFLVERAPTSPRRRGMLRTSHSGVWRGLATA